MTSDPTDPTALPASSPAQTEDERRAASDRLWVPDNADGSGWADVDWVSAARGSRYHYRHGAPLAEAERDRPACYLVRTRLESDELIPHENDYYVPAPGLADFLGELSLAGGAEVVWHVEPWPEPPPEARVTLEDRGGR
jgi:hypothetical protein